MALTRPRHLAYCHEAEQTFTHVRPRTLALLALTYKLSLLLWCSPSGNEYLSTYCFQLEWTIGNMVSALQWLLQSEMGKWYKEGRTKDMWNEKKNNSTEVCRVVILTTWWLFHYQIWCFENRHILNIVTKDLHAVLFSWECGCLEVCLRM